MCILKGPIPTPIYFGAIVNTTCRLWEMTCGERGNCWIYDVDKFRQSLWGMLVVFNSLSTLFAVFALLALPFTLKTKKVSIAYVSRSTL